MQQDTGHLTLPANDRDANACAVQVVRAAGVFECRMLNWTRAKLSWHEV